MPKSDSSDRGTPEDANSEGSSGADNQKGSSEQEFLTVAEFQRQLALEREALRRQFQSEKDKGVKATNERLAGIETDVKTMLRQASAENRSVKDVLADLDAQEAQEERRLLLEMAKAFKSGQFPQTSPQGSGRTRGEVDILAVIDEFGLDPDDARVKALTTRSFETIEDAEKATVALIKKINKTSALSDAERPSGETEGGSKPVAKLDKLWAEYNAKATNTRGNALIALKMEYRKKGLPVS